MKKRIFRSFQKRDREWKKPNLSGLLSEFLPLFRIVLLVNNDSLTTRTCRATAHWNDTRSYRWVKLDLDHRWNYLLYQDDSAGFLYQCPCLTRQTQVLSHVATKFMTFPTTEEAVVTHQHLSVCYDVWALLCWRLSVAMARERTLRDLAEMTHCRNVLNYRVLLSWPSGRHQYPRLPLFWYTER